MNRQLIYDLPLRLYHFIFAALFSIAYLISNTIDDDSALFSLHMLAGIALTFVIVQRIVWGIIGTKYSRFSELPLNPSQLIEYISGVFTAGDRKWAGHNPASAWAGLTMMVLALALGFTGYLMSAGYKSDFIEDAHELLANGFLVVVILHLAGLALHTMKYRDNIGLSMVHGHKSELPREVSIASPHNTSGLIFLAIFLLFVGAIISGYDSKTRNLNLFGSSISLGENEGGEHKKPSEATAKKKRKKEKHHKD